MPGLSFAIDGGGSGEAEVFAYGEDLVTDDPSARESFGHEVETAFTSRNPTEIPINGSTLGGQRASGTRRAQFSAADPHPGLAIVLDWGKRGKIEGLLQRDFSHLARLFAS